VPHSLLLELFTDAASHEDQAAVSDRDEHSSDYARFPVTFVRGEARGCG